VITRIEGDATRGVVKQSTTLDSLRIKIIEVFSEIEK